MGNNNNNQEINFENFYENMLNSLNSLNYEISLKESEINSSKNNVQIAEIYKGLVSIVAFAISPGIIYWLWEYCFRFMMQVLFLLFVIVEMLREYYLDTIKIYLQLQVELRAKIAEKEALLAVCNSFGIEIPEPLEDDKLVR